MLRDPLPTTTKPQYLILTLCEYIALPVEWLVTNMRIEEEVQEGEKQLALTDTGVRVVCDGWGLRDDYEITDEIIRSQH